jgi:hypothetical protein
MSEKPSGDQDDSGPQRSNNSTSETKKDHKKCGDVTVTVTQEAPKTDDQSPTHYQYRKDQKDFRLRSVATFFAVIAAVVAAFAAYFTWQQVDEMRKSTKAELRAYVLAKRYPFVNAVIASKKAHSRVNYRNSGQTPASNLEIRESIAVGSKPPRIEPDVFEQSQITMRGGLIDPKDEINIGPILYLPSELTDEQVNAIRNKSQSVYIWGVVFYDDIFKKKRHRSYFVLCITE